MLLGFLGFGLGPMELLIVGVIAVLLFGKRLPEVGRSLGKGLVEFKKGLRDIQDEMDRATDDRGSSGSTASQTAYHNAIDDYDQPTAPKFEPPAREPQAAEDQPTAEAKV
jgi:sec-independent protein translocase protein TatA